MKNSFQSILTTDECGIAKAWGVKRLVSPDLLKKLQQTGLLIRKTGSGPPISVMTGAVKKKLIGVLMKNNVDRNIKS